MNLEKPKAIGLKVNQKLNINQKKYGCGEHITKSTDCYTNYISPVFEPMKHYVICLSGLMQKTGFGQLAKAYTDPSLRRLLEQAA